jgi:hypothetical protein
VVVSDLGNALEGFGRLIPGDPVAVVDGEFGAVELRFVADDDSIVGRVQFDDVQRMCGGNPEAFALADGVEFYAVMVSEHPALGVHDFAGVPLHKFRLFEESSVIVVGHETNLHRLFFVGGAQPALASHVAGVRFGFLAEWEKHSSQLVLAE